MYYSVPDGARFKLWIEAAIHKKRTGSQIFFDYHNDMWKAIRQEFIPDRPLPELYAEQVRRIRENYDYISLLYSGGADSHNILMTFLNNNIHLDEVISCDSSLGRPATYNDSPLNLHSEFELTAKPMLKWVEHTYPRIKIRLIESSKKSIIDHISGDLTNRISKHRLLQVFSAYEHDIQVQSKGTLIVGQDKPYVLKQDDQFYFSFSNIIGHFADRKFVPFYWDYNFPELHINQCRAIARAGLCANSATAKESEIVGKNKTVELLYGHTWHGGFQVKKIKDYVFDNPYVDLYNHVKPGLWQKIQDLRSDLIKTSNISHSDIYPCRTEQFHLYLPPQS